jgi:hypothetical protein
MVSRRDVAISQHVWRKAALLSMWSVINHIELFKYGKSEVADGRHWGSRCRSQQTTSPITQYVPMCNQKGRDGPDEIVTFSSV